MAIGSVYLEAEPIENLVLRTENAVNYTTFRVNQYEDGRMGQHYAKDGYASVMANLTNYMQTENTVTYKLEADKHKFSVMGGFSASRSAYEDATAVSKDLNSITRYNNLNAAKNHGPNSSWASASTLVSFFGRLTYNFNERYLATVTMRGDGSSRFAPGHQWGFFPSAAFAWRISEEKFLKNARNVNNLKLRLSVGRLGNQNIGDYMFAALVSEGGYFNDYVFGGEKLQVLSIAPFQTLILHGKKPIPSMPALISDSSRDAFQVPLRDITREQATCSGQFLFHMSQDIYHH